MGWAWAAVVALALLGTGADAADDRLARVRELGRILGDAGETSPADADAALAELFELADAEIAENLGAGEPFASAAFVQERLDAFSAVWGGASFRVERLAAPGAPGGVTVAVFSVPGSAPRGVVRVYGRDAAGRVSRLAAISHDGVPEIHRWATARDGTPRFVATWLGAASGAGGQPLHVELWRAGGRGGADRIWSSAAAFPDGLWTLGFAVKPDGIAIRSEPRYPGWKPGCPGQTQLVDLYRPEPRRERLVLARRAVVDGWHRDLGASVDRLFAALAGSDARALARLVPDRALAARLPRTLGRDAACDAATGRPPSSVVVAAAADDRGRIVPWSLTWRKSAQGWRLSAAMPVLQ